MHFFVQLDSTFLLLEFTCTSIFEIFSNKIKWLKSEKGGKVDKKSRKGTFMLVSELEQEQILDTSIKNNFFVLEMYLKLSSSTSRTFQVQKCFADATFESCYNLHNFHNFTSYYDFGKLPKLSKVLLDVLLM